MARIAVKVGRGAVRYRVAVQAESVGRALEIVEGLNPGGDFRMTCPIDPEASFVRDTASTVGGTEPEKPAA